MLRVLRHYLPLRKALLIFSETLLLTAVLMIGLTSHLWQPTSRVLYALANQIPALSLESAQLRCVVSAIILAVLSQTAIAFNELYDVRLSSSRYDRAARFVESAGTALGLSLAAVLIGGSARLGRLVDLPGLTLSQRLQTVIFSMLLGFALLYGWRTFFHYLLRRVSFNERVLIIGSGKAASELAHEIRERPDSGFDVVGLIDEDTGELVDVEPRLVSEATTLQGTVAMPAARGDAATATAVRTVRTVKLAAGTERRAPQGDRSQRDRPPGNSHGLPIDSGPTNGGGDAGEDTDEGSLYALVQDCAVDLVAVALADRRSKLPTQELLRCRLAGIDVREQEEIYERITGKLAVEAMRPSYLIFNQGFSSHPWSQLAKRTVDVVIALVGILLSWPLMLLTALIVRLDSPGPILFSQERVGADGKPFTLHKFRSMRADAEKLSGPVWAQQDDPRITRSGRFIRKTRLDELPQLFNVLLGDMAMVGPRPERPPFVEELGREIPYYNQRHIVKPGITGWAQINYPYGNTTEDSLRKLQYDLFYIKNQSSLFDLSILFNTVKIILLRKGT